jgi:cyclic pyranopterin phosphate synthase
MPSCGVEKIERRQLLTIEEMAHVAEVMVERFGIRAIRLTGGEPLIREGLGSLVSLLARLDIADLAMTTNAQGLASAAADLKSRGLLRVNISLDTLDATRFAQMTGGGLIARTLDGIDAALEAGLTPVKLNMVVMRGLNEDEIVKIARWGLGRGCEVRYLELMPIGVARPSHASLFVKASEVLAVLSRDFALERLGAEPGSTAVLYEADGRGRIGIISPQTEPFCSECGRMRLTTEGRLLGCLHEEGGVDLKEALRAPGGPDDEALGEAIARAIAAKPECRSGTRRSPMYNVGG